MRLYLPSPDLSTFSKLQRKPKAHPAFPCFAGSRQQGNPCWQKFRDEPPHRRQRSRKLGFGVNRLVLGQSHLSFSILSAHKEATLGSRAVILSEWGNPSPGVISPHTGPFTGEKTRNFFPMASAVGQHIPDHIDLWNLISISQLDFSNLPFGKNLGWETATLTASPNMRWDTGYPKSPCSLRWQRLLQFPRWHCWNPVIEIFPALWKLYSGWTKTWAECSSLPLLPMMAQKTRRNWKSPGLLETLPFLPVASHLPYSGRKTPCWTAF